MHYFNNICLQCGCEDLNPKDNYCSVCQAVIDLEELLAMSRRMRRREFVQHIRMAKQGQQQALAH